jgi:tetratricopeptide (TPR) repeat protein
MEALVPDVASLCELAVITARGGDTRAGLQMAQQAYRCARADGSSRSRMLALNAMALCQLTSGRNIESIGSAIDAFRIAQAEGDHRIALQALTTLLGASNHLYGTEEITLPMTSRALEMAQLLEDASLVARLHNSRAVIFNMLGRFDDCEAELSLAMTAAGDKDRITPPALIAANFAHAAVMRVRKGTCDPLSLENARRKIADALAMAVAAKSGEAQIRLWFCRGILHHDCDELDDAIAALNQSINLAAGLHHDFRIVDARLELASVYEARGDLASAAALLESAFQAAMPLRPCRQLGLLAEQLAKIHERLGSAREAAFANDLARKEQLAYEQERVSASRELEHFWHEVDPLWQAGHRQA